MATVGYPPCWPGLPTVCRRSSRMSPQSVSTRTSSGNCSRCKLLNRNHNVHAARALSDGTLRFLALAILENDPGSQGLLCFEEPENGIHPERIVSMLELLRGLCVDTHEPIGDENPLRQVIVNTHSPVVVGLIDDDDLLMAGHREVFVDGERSPAVSFRWLEDTWRYLAAPSEWTASKGELCAYLNPFAFADAVDKLPRRRVKDRKDMNMLLPGLAASE